MSGLIYAADALGITMKVRRERTIEAINKASADGKAFCEVYGWLDTDFRTELSRLGYTFRDRRGPSDLETTTLIAWAYPRKDEK